MLIAYYSSIVELWNFSTVVTVENQMNVFFVCLISYDSKMKYK